MWCALRYFFLIYQVTSLVVLPRRTCSSWVTELPVDALLDYWGSLCAYRLSVFCTHVALLPVYLSALYVHLFATTDSKWRVVNIITPPVHCIEMNSLYASDGELLKGGPSLGELPAVVGGLWGDTHKVGFCIWSIFECVLFWLSVCSIAYVTIFNVYRHYTRSFTAVEGAPCLV